tara:strand:- start:2289 stop:2444 length:156 start_codon:yes stop_codon:yes gene_type:complete
MSIKEDPAFSGQNRSYIPNDLSLVFGMANSLIVSAEIERDKNDRFGYWSIS